MPTRRVWPAVKLAIAVVILAGVGRHFANVLTTAGFDVRSLSLRLEPLVPAGLLYLTAHTVWGTFWWMLLRAEGVAASWRTAVGAYFVSQFGKYVPGKVWVIALRVGLLHNVPGATKAAIATTGVYETLTSMAAGAMIAAVLVPLLGIGGEFAAGQVPWFAGLAAVPIGVGLLNKLAKRIAAKRAERRQASGDVPNARPIPAPPVWLLLLGLLQATAGWCLLGVSLLLVVAAVEPAAAVGFPVALGATAAAYIVGFVAFVAPGGLGAREYVLQEALGPFVPAASAVVVAVLARLVWTAFEVALSGLIYLRGKGTRRDAP